MFLYVLKSLVNIINNYNYNLKTDSFMSVK